MGYSDQVRKFQLTRKTFALVPFFKDKPGLVLKPNHAKFVTQPSRRWDSHVKGTAYADGKGWYIDGAEKKRKGILHFSFADLRKKLKG